MAYGLGFIVYGRASGRSETEKRQQRVARMRLPNGTSYELLSPDGRFRIWGPRIQDTVLASVNGSSSHTCPILIIKARILTPIH